MDRSRVIVTRPLETAPQPANIAVSGGTSLERLSRGLYDG